MVVPPVNLLWSYAYARNTDVAKSLAELNAPNGLRFFADSGAHSARTLGIHLDVDSYATWLLRWHDHLTIYANLDVIWAPKATRDNQRALEAAGLSPMPVFHTGEDFDHLRRYLDDGYTYIALGKLLGNSRKNLEPWIERAFAIAGDRAVFHGFGMTTWPMLRRFPWYSVDSSSWGSGFRYGSLRLFDRGRWVTVRLRDRTDIRAHHRLLESYGIAVGALTKRDYARAKIAPAAAAAYYRAARWLQHHHGNIVLPKGKGYPDPSGITAPVLPATHGGRLTVYLADTTLVAHKCHAEGVVADSTRHRERRTA